MYLRKHAAIGISLIMAMASISGCGGAKGGNGAPQNKETQGKETQDKGAQDKGGQDKAAQGNHRIPLHGAVRKAGFPG